MEPHCGSIAAGQAARYARRLEQSVDWLTGGFYFPAAPMQTA